jgi:asparagine synthase (glutamine-hydrolysing)
MIRLFSPRQLGELGFREVATIDQPPDWEQQIDPAEASRRWDLFHYLPFDLLRKVDRASMAVALEVRCPMLDTQVCDFAFHLPLRVLAPWGQPKRLLKQAAADLLPPEVLARPKMGFAVPIGHWFRTTHRSMLREHLLDGPLDELGCRRDQLERMIQQHEAGRIDHTHRLFALLSLSIWLGWRQDPQPA